MNEIACAVDGKDTDQPRNEQGECGLEEHVRLRRSHRLGRQTDGYALEVVSEAWKEIDENWRGPRVETAKRTAPDVGIRRSDGQRNVADAQKLRTSTRGQSDDEARQNRLLLVSQRPEDGGPTIRLPAAEIPLHPSSPEFESSNATVAGTTLK